MMQYPCHYCEKREGKVIHKGFFCCKQCKEEQEKKDQTESEDKQLGVRKTQATPYPGSTIITESEAGE